MRTTTDMTRGALDTRNPDLLALTVTIGHASELIRNDATPDEWAAFTEAIATEQTPAELANMLTGACTILARITGATPTF
jgi:hypothetical protein